MSDFLFILILIGIFVVLPTILAFLTEEDFRKAIFPKTYGLRPYILNTGAQVWKRYYKYGIIWTYDNHFYTNFEEGMKAIQKLQSVNRSDTKRIRKNKKFHIIKVKPESYQ